MIKMAFVNHNTRCTHCGGLLDSNGNCISCEKALRERYKYTVDPRLIRRKKIKKTEKEWKWRELRSDLGKLFRLFFLSYAVILFMAFIVAAISYRYNTELLKATSIVVVLCTILIITIRFVFDIISKSVFGYMILKFVISTVVALILL